MKKLVRGHAAFLRECVAGSAGFLSHLASTHQSPDALFIGCADSRVIPELLTGSAPGELFVVRNVANLVPPASQSDNCVGAALEYAVQCLHVQHVIVCGHYGCGGVRAMIDGVDRERMPELAAWLEPAAAEDQRAREGMPAARASPASQGGETIGIPPGPPFQPATTSGSPEAKLGSSRRSGTSGGGSSEGTDTHWRLAVEENVLDQVANLPTYPCVREALDAGRLALHGWVYELHGSLRVYDARRMEFAPCVGDRG